MNKEHFLIELKIYLKPLPVQHQSAVLEKYEEIFDMRTASGETEEQIAKSLGKPRSIAQEVLQEFDIEVPEKRLTRDGWEEISSAQQEASESEHPYENNPYEHDPEFPYSKEPYYGPRRKEGPRFLRISALLAFDFLFMVWMFFAFAAVVFSLWLVAIIFILTPIWGAYSVTVGFNDAALFQLFSTIGLCGIGIIGSVILLPLTKLFFSSIKRYLAWHGTVLGRRV